MLFENIDVISSQNKNTSSLKFTRPKTLWLRPQRRIFRVAQDQITTASSATSQHSPGQDNRQKNVFFLYIVELFHIFCCVCSPIQTRFISSSSGGAQFHFISLFLSAEIPAGAAGGKVNGQSLLRVGNEGQFPVVQDEKTRELGPHLIFKFQTLQFPQ